MVFAIFTNVEIYFNFFSHSEKWFSKLALKYNFKNLQK